MLCDNRGAGYIGNLSSAAAGTAACMHVVIRQTTPQAGWGWVDASVHVLGCVCGACV